MEDGGGFRRPAVGLRKRDESHFVGHIQVSSSDDGYSLPHLSLKFERLGRGPVDMSKECENDRDNVTQHFYEKYATTLNGNAKAFSA